MEIKNAKGTKTVEWSTSSQHSQTWAVVQLHRGGKKSRTRCSKTFSECSSANEKCKRKMKNYVWERSEIRPEFKKKIVFIFHFSIACDTTTNDDDGKGRRRIKHKLVEYLSTTNCFSSSFRCLRGVCIIIETTENFWLGQFWNEPVPKQHGAAHTNW